MDYSKKQIFTFINFKDFIPPYIILCIKALTQCPHKKFNAVVLTPDNLSRYIDEKFLQNNIIKNFEPYSPIFCDYIGFCVLYCNGGVFIDADTIITDNFLQDFELLKKYEAAFFTLHDEICSGYMMGRKRSEFILKFINTYNSFDFWAHKKQKRNQIINKMIKNIQQEEVLLTDNSICSYKMEALSEKITAHKQYLDYYFSPKYSVEHFIKNNKGICALKNSQTPEKYKKMSESEFLKQDILLSKIFKVLI